MKQSLVRLAWLTVNSARDLAPIVAVIAFFQLGVLRQPLPDLAGSYLHMHANRFLRSAARAQELVLYDFLLRLKRSQAARQRKKSK